MRVIELELRTPGLFLDKENGFAGSLTFEVRRGTGSWGNINNDPVIKVLSGSVEVGTATTKSVATTTLKVPDRSGGTKKYYLLTRDDDAFEYRVKATACPDCVDFFREIGETGSIEDEATGKVIVGGGQIS